MSEITIRNKEFLKTLNDISDEFFAMDNYNNPECYVYSSEEDMSKGEYYCSQEYLDECLSRDKLVGVPDRHFTNPSLRWFV